MSMYQINADAATFTVPVYLYGLFVALGALFMLAVLSVTRKKLRLPDGTAALCGAMGMPAALILSRAMYVAFNFNTHYYLGSLRAILMFWSGGFSMTGALTGMALSALLAAKILKAPALRMLDALSPALLAFILFERIGEGFTELLGRSRPLVTEWLKTSFLSEGDGWGGYFLATYRLEAAAALALLIIMLLYISKPRRDGDAFWTCMLLFGASQTLFESLRFDSHMRLSFISVQQIFSALFLAAAVCAFAVRCIRQKQAGRLAILAFCYLPVLVGALVFLEFKIDRSGVSDFVWYGLYIALLSVPCVLGLTLRNRSCRNWTK